MDDQKDRKPTPGERIRKVGEAGTGGLLAGGMVGAPLTGAALAALKETGKQLFQAAGEHFSDRAHAELGEIADELEEKVEKLESAGSHARASLAVLLETWAESRKHAASDRKARLLQAALLHAFEPDAYHEGLSRTILHVLDQLDYADIRLLRAATSLFDCNADQDCFERVTTQFPEFTAHSRRGMSFGGYGSMQKFHADRLHEARLILDDAGEHIEPTQLGRKVLEFVRAGFELEH